MRESNCNRDGSPQLTFTFGKLGQFFGRESKAETGAAVLMKCDADPYLADASVRVRRVHAGGEVAALSAYIIAYTDSQADVEPHALTALRLCRAVAHELAGQGAGCDGKE